MNIAGEICDVEEVNDELVSGMIKYCEDVNWRDPKAANRIRADAKYRKAIIMKLCVEGGEKGKYGITRRRVR